VLDDDVALHPLSLCQLVDEMQADPELFMATGGCSFQCEGFWVCSSYCSYVSGDESLNSATLQVLNACVCW
jgi:hypothetical protein